MALQIRNVLISPQALAFVRRLDEPGCSGSDLQRAEKRWAVTMASAPTKIGNESVSCIFFNLTVPSGGVPDRRTRAYPTVGHNPHLEAPEIFNRELIRFLSSDPDTPAVRAGRQDNQGSEASGQGSGSVGA